MAISRDEIIKELKREISMRHRVYPKWVHSGRMKADDAKWRIERMQAALDHFEALPADQGSLL